MRVLIIGASGLLGRALVKAFAQAGHEVGGVDVRSRAMRRSWGIFTQFRR